MIYSIEIAICLALFYMIYWLFLRKETFFKLNRFYLLFSVIISLLLPLLNINLVSNSGENSFLVKYLITPIEQYEQNFTSGMKENYLLKQYGFIPSENHNIVNEGGSSGLTDNHSIITGATSLPNQSPLINSKQAYNWVNRLLIVYFIGVALFFIRFIINLVWLFSYVIKSRSQQISGTTVIQLERNLSPFSFFNYVFLNPTHCSDEEMSNILAHEKIHIQQRHSIDVIMFELLLVFQWFNPFVWFYKRDIKITHEYLADIGTLDSGIELEEYHYALLNQTLRANNFEITSSFNLSVKKRIAMMMKKRSSRWATLKFTLALPTLFVLFSAFAVNCNTSEEANNVKTIALKDTSIKKVNVPLEYLKLLEGEYISTNEGRERRIVFSELLGQLFGWDGGYTYKIIPVGGEKFINPDDKATLEFNSKNKDSISMLIFGRVKMKKVKVDKGNVANKSMAFTLANIMLKDGIEKALAYHKKAKDSSNYFLTEIDMSYAGMELIEKKRNKEAVALLKLDTELFGGNYNAYDSYGEALFLSGDKAQATAAFKESIKLNPGSKNGINRLKELGVNPDDVVKPIKISDEEIKLLEGVYLSTNQPNWMRKITITSKDGELKGEDNGYNYRLIAVGNGKFINPDDGVALIWDTKDKNAISFLIFGQVTMRKVKTSMEPTLKLAEYSGTYLPEKKDTILKPMEILNSANKLFRFIENPDDYTANRNIELEFVTGNIFFYPDKSARSIEFVVNDKKEVTGCILRRPDGTYNLTKKK